MKNKILLVGARGVGKTSFLRRWEQRQDSAAERRWLDLDEEIERRLDRSIQHLFENEGESVFREVEIATLRDLLQSNTPTTIAIGAGFPWNRWEWPIDRNSVEVIWIRRSSDEAGRILLDRPRLDPDLLPIEEYLRRLQLRTPWYEKICDWVYEIPEGLTEKTAGEKDLLATGPVNLGGCFTVHERHLRLSSEKGLHPRWEDWSFDHLELRSDEWSLEQMQQWQEWRTRSPRSPSFLWALRPSEKETTASEVLQKIREWHRDGDLCDWALELGLPSEKDLDLISVLSLHGNSLVFPRVSKKLHLKWSPVIENWSELIRGHTWQSEDPQHRSFLPRTGHYESGARAGRWSWYRLWMKGRQKINFVRESQSLALDQPTLHEWLRTPSRTKQFAAVIGDPIRWSWSPVEQEEFFRKQGLPFFAIPVSVEEFLVAVGFLEKLGLCAAAVTAPLKRRAFEWLDQEGVGTIGSVGRELRSLNTLYRGSDGQWSGDNTDLEGLDAIARHEFFQEPVAIWGGGGTLPGLRKLFPKAICYSARTGQPRDPSSMEGVSQPFMPKTVVWAAGPEDPAPFNVGLKWVPSTIFDLNYRSDSRGRLFAFETNAQFISGAEMFRTQAAAQRRFWEKAQRGG